MERRRESAEHDPGLAIRRCRHLHRGVVHPGQVGEAQQFFLFEQGKPDVGGFAFGAAGLDDVGEGFETPDLKDAEALVNELA